MKLKDDHSIFPWPYLCVWKAGSAFPLKPPRQHCQREDEDVGGLVGSSKSTIKIKKANIDFGRIRLDGCVYDPWLKR